MNLKRILFNLYFYIAPGAATRWLNFKFDAAEALDNIARDESGELSDLEAAVLLGLVLFILALFSCSFLPSWPPK